MFQKNVKNVKIKNKTNTIKWYQCSKKQKQQTMKKMNLF